MKQTWSQLLFLHYPVQESVLRPLVPDSLPLDSFQGTAWVSVTPFRLTGLRLRWLPPLPSGSRFLETNVRTYVTLDGKAGVFFFSLDASSPLAVLGARVGFGLPYFHADMQIKTRGAEFKYRTRRRSASRPELRVTYAPTGPPNHAVEGTLDYFLTERYCLYTVRRAGVYRAEIHHKPWPLQPVKAEIQCNTLPEAAKMHGVTEPFLPASKFVRKLDVLVWAPERCC
jgi:uncharacterized protein YqjF (DUF2071 family)